LTGSPPGAGVPWRDRRIAVIGGDQRDPQIARLAAATGATVHAYGLPWPAEGVPGVTLAPTPQAAAAGADYVLFPIPLGVGLLVYAPHAPAPIVADRALLGVLAPAAHLFCGRATPELRQVATEAGIELHEYDPDRELMLLRAPAIVEGAIHQAIEHTDVTIHAARVVVVGYGTIGSLLARQLRLLGAHVHVAARNPVQRAAAHADGATPLPLEELPALAPALDMVFSTVPARVVGREVLERLPRGSLVLDIAPPPDHADLDLAAELGHRAVWARGLGRRAPVTVGRSQWMGLARRIEELERRRREPDAAPEQADAGRAGR
jgi:dipicolinate synthase subunit A